MEKLAIFVNYLSRKKYLPLATRILSLFFFILLTASLFYGTINIFTYKFTSKAAMFTVWILWWPFLYITLLFFSRLWCGFLCPISLANEWGNKLRTGKFINYRKWAFVPFILFFVIVYLEQMSGLFLSTSVTLWFFLLFFLLAFLMGLMLSRFAFCKLVCPIGTILGLFSRLSVIGLRTKKEICETCPKKYCLLGGKKAPCPMFINIPKINSNKDCLLCANCVKNCPHDAVHIGVIKPGKELIEKVDFTMAESYFIMALFGLAAILTANGTMLARKFLYSFSFYMIGPTLRFADFAIGIGFFILLYTLMAYIMSKVTKTKFKISLSELGYYYLPLLFMIMFYTISFGFLGPWLPINESAMRLIKYFFLTLGGIWSIYMIFKIPLPNHVDLTTKQKKIGKSILIVFLAFITIIWAGFLISNNTTFGDKESVISMPGEIIKMDSFSMGFTPNVIIAEKGQEISIEIDNIDIMHSFDLNEFNVHEFLPAAKKKVIAFTPDKVGEFMFFCNVPGHTEAGMRGRLVVVDSIDDYMGKTKRKLS